jgi:hypothetical protein
VQIITKQATTTVEHKFVTNKTYKGSFLKYIHSIQYTPTSFFWEIVLHHWLKQQIPSGGHYPRRTKTSTALLACLKFI